MICNRCATPIPDSSRFCLSCGADVSGASGERTHPVEIDAELLARLREDVAPDYEIVRELGRGGMAAVFLATDVHLGRKIAVKVLPPELTFGRGMVERFKREARTAATLDHPHIIPIFRVSTSGKLFWYAMKYLEGESLGAVLEREHSLPPSRTADILMQVAQALDYAAKHGVIHRDVKPANIMLDAEGWVTVTDFGIAKATDTQSLTGSGSMIGTPYYMSPEQCSGRKVTGASDQYALGIVAYQVLSSHLPFTGQAIVDIIKKHCMDLPPPLAVLRPDLPAALIAAVERALSKSPEDRFPTATDFARALQAATLDVSPQRLIDSEAATRRISATLALSHAPPPVASAVATGRRRPRRIPIGLTVGAIAIAGAVAVFGPNVVTHGTLPPGPEPERLVTSQPTAQASPVAAAAPVVPDSIPAATVPDTAPANAVITLPNLPAAATVFLDGRRVRGARFSVASGQRHVVRIEAPGFARWSRVLRPGASEVVPLVVRLTPLAPETTAVTRTAAIPPPAAAAPLARPVTPEAAAPSAGSEMARLSFGSRPRSSAIFINGARAPTYPVRDFPVPPGLVRIRFEVTDSTRATWSRDTTITVQPRETRALGFIQLRRP